MLGLYLISNGSLLCQYEVSYPSKQFREGLSSALSRRFLLLHVVTYMRVLFHPLRICPYCLLYILRNNGWVSSGVCIFQKVSDNDRCADWHNQTNDVIVCPVDWQYQCIVSRS